MTVTAQLKRDRDRWICELEAESPDGRFHRVDRRGHTLSEAVEVSSNALAIEIRRAPLGDRRETHLRSAA